MGTQAAFNALMRQYLKNPQDGDISNDKECIEVQLRQLVSWLKSNDALNAATNEPKNNNEKLKLTILLTARKQRETTTSTFNFAKKVAMM